MNRAIKFILILFGLMCAVVTVCIYFRVIFVVADWVELQTGDKFLGVFSIIPMVAAPVLVFVAWVISENHNK